MRQAVSWCQRLMPARWWVRALEQRNQLLSWLYPEPYRSVLPYTMMALRRLRALRELALRVDRLGVPGDLVECGTCRGGSGALLAQTASRSPFARHTWLLDSFAGLPAPGFHDGEEAHRYRGECSGSQAQVWEVLRRAGVPEAAVSVVPGWFHDTVPTLPVARVSLLHIDADFYEPVLLVLRCLFDRVADGGFVVLDDYGTWPGCRRALEDFFAERSLRLPLSRIDGHAVSFQKPGPAHVDPAS